MSLIQLMCCLILFNGCTVNDKSDNLPEVYIDTAVGEVDTDTSRPVRKPLLVSAPGNSNRDSIVNFAKSLAGIPYKYASTNPAEGFDCSGFITYVFNHFKIKVPRSSVDFTNVGKEVHVKEAKKGDLILFTGTDSLVRIVGHMGIVTSNEDTLKFIHSTSGKAYGVTETPLNKYYLGRFVKVIDIF